MFRIVLCMMFIALCASISLAAKGPEFIDPQEAAKDPDFQVQGEYVGEGTWPASERTRYGAQVVAQGDQKFRVVVYRGGLPGDGWKKGDDRARLEGETTDGALKLGGKEFFSGSLVDGKLALNDSGGQQLAKLTRVARTSSTLGASPPDGAAVLFDGSTVDSFPGATLTDMKTLQAGCTMKPDRKIQKLHLEFRLSWKPHARGQGRSNSGVHIGGIPEIQVLDSFGLEGARNECGAFYGRREPNVNMCFPPMKWQTYDIEFSQPKRDGDGKPLENTRVTVRHNGVVVHENYDAGKKDAPNRRLHLQAHGNRVQYRNIWIVEAK